MEKKPRKYLSTAKIVVGSDHKVSLRQCCGAGTGRSRKILVGAGASVKVRLWLHLR